MIKNKDRIVFVIVTIIVATMAAITNSTAYIFLTMIAIAGYTTLTLRGASDLDEVIT